MMVFARIVFWVLLLAGALFLYKKLRQLPRFRSPEEQNSSFPCPYCGEKITPSDRKEGEYYRCWECQRTVIRWRKPTKEESARILEEQEDCAAVARNLNSGELFERVISPIHYPNALVIHISAWEDRVDLEVVTRTVNPYNPLDDKMETIPLDPGPLPYRIQTNAGRVAFHRAVIDYVRRYYSDSWNPAFASDRLHIGLGRK